MARATIRLSYASGPRGRAIADQRGVLLKGLLFLYATIASYAIALFSERLLPDRFFFDDSTIQDYIAGREGGYGPSPFTTTAFL